MLSPSPYLRRVLVIDALASGAMSALLILGAEFLEGLLGIPSTLSRVAGLVLVPYVALVVLLATRSQVLASAVWLLIFANTLWVGASLLLLASGAISPNVLGVLFVIAQGAVVGIFGTLQYVGLRASRSLRDQAPA